MLNYKGAIFDMDGTILDSMKLWQEIDVYFLEKRGIKAPSNYVKSIAHLNIMDTALYTIERFNLKDSPEDLIQEWKTLAGERYKTVPEKPGIFEYLKYLKEHGIKTSIATATHISLLKKALEGRKIADYIDCVTTVDEVNHGKGFPDVYYKCCERMELKPEDCVVFEDIVLGIKGAKAGGFRAVAMYDVCSKNDEALLRELSDKYIYDFREMIEPK